VVNTEGKNMCQEFGKEYEGKPPSHYDVRFVRKLQAMFWVLDAILRTDVAEDLVRAFALSDLVQQTIYNTQYSGNSGLAVIKDLAKVVLCIYKGMVGGHLLLETPARVALLRNWRWLLECNLSRDEYDDATKQLFLTLPLKNQMELIKLNGMKFDDYISGSSLISTLSKGCNWQDMKLDLDASHPEDN